MFSPLPNQCFVKINYSLSELLVIKIAKINVLYMVILCDWISVISIWDWHNVGKGRTVNITGKWSMNDHIIPTSKWTSVNQNHSSVHLCSICQTRAKENSAVKSILTFWPAHLVTPILLLEPLVKQGWTRRSFNIIIFKPMTFSNVGKHVSKIQPMTSLCTLWWYGDKQPSRRLVPY